MSTVEAIRDVTAEFPVLRREFDGQPLCYLDSAATSQTPQPVIDAMTGYYTDTRASIHRGVYPLAVEATELFEGARRRIADWLGSTVEETIFTANATAAINLVAYTWGRQNVGPGDLVVLTEMEHHSNIVPWQLLCQEREAELAYVPVLDDGRLDLEALDGLLARGPKLLARRPRLQRRWARSTRSSRSSRRAHDAGAVVVVDGSQAVPQIPVDLRAIDADFYAWTGHKAYGPTGIGVLHGRRELLERMPPFIGGGHMIKMVGDTESTWTDLPWKFEAGTSQIAEAIGLGAAVDWIAGARHRADPGARDRAGDRRARAAGRRFPGSRSTGRPRPTTAGRWCRSCSTAPIPTMSARSSGARASACAPGHHCAQPLMRRLGVPATTRASFAAHNSVADTDRLIDALGTVAGRAAARSRSPVPRRRWR